MTAARALERDARPDVIRVFTTRPDTLFGATYMVLAPEHPLVDELTTPEHQAAVAAYREQAARKSEIDRTEPGQDEDRRIHGRLRHQPGQRRIDPRLDRGLRALDYGTGAIMAVPGHDERDFEFARDVQSEDRPGGRAWHEPGR